MATLFLISLVPLVLFAIINYYGSLRSGVVSGVIAALVMAALSYHVFDYFDYELVIMVLLLLVMGVWSLRSNNEIYFKMQPALTSVCSVAVLAWYQFFEQPLLIRLLPKVLAMLPPEQAALLSSPQAHAYLARITGYGMIWILLHAALLAWTAKNSKTSVWLATKALFLPYFLIATVATEYIYAQMS